MTLKLESIIENQVPNLQLSNEIELDKILYIGVGTSSFLECVLNMNFNKLYLIEPNEIFHKSIHRKLKSKLGVQVFKEWVFPARKNEGYVYHYQNPRYDSISAVNDDVKTEQLFKEKKKTTGKSIADLFHEFEFKPKARNILILSVNGAEREIIDSCIEEVKNLFELIILEVRKSNVDPFIKESKIGEYYSINGKVESHENYFCYVLNKKTISLINRNRLLKESLSYKNQVLGLEPDNLSVDLGSAMDIHQLKKSCKNYFISSIYKQEKLNSKFNNATKDIIIGSMPRSGSTWLYNCVRTIFNLKGIDFYSSWVDEYDVSNKQPVHIIKVHEPIDAIRYISDKTKVITIRRDIRDIAASLKRMGWLAEGNKYKYQLWKIIELMDAYWTKRADLILCYSLIKKQNRAIIINICESLGVIINEQEIGIIQNKMHDMSSPQKFDPETQLHPKHISMEKTDAEDYLDESQLRFINEYFGDWLLEFNRKKEA